MQIGLGCSAPTSAITACVHVMQARQGPTLHAAADWPIRAPNTTHSGAIQACGLLTTARLEGQGQQACETGGIVIRKQKEHDHTRHRGAMAANDSSAFSAPKPPPATLALEMKWRNCWMFMRVMCSTVTSASPCWQRSKHRGSSSNHWDSSSKHWGSSSDDRLNVKAR